MTWSARAFVSFPFLSSPVSCLYALHDGVGLLSSNPCISFFVLLVAAFKSAQVSD